MKQYIEFKKQRDFSDLLTDTFGFIRNEFKPLMKALFNIAGPAILLFLACLVLYMYVTGDVFNIDIYGTSSYSDFSPFLVIILALMYLGSMVIAYVFASSTVLYYIKSYIDNKGEVNLQDVRREAYRSFWGILGLTILKSITLFFALLLCVLPVFYVMVPMMIALSIYVFQPKRGATDAYSHSFYLVNEDFWLSLGTIVVLGIIFYVLNFVFSLPTLIYTYAKMGVFSGEIDPANFGSMTDPVYILINVLATLFQYLLNLILIVGGAFIYFHLNEKRNFTGTYERINSIGNPDV